jgi:hypothetical protein
LAVSFFIITFARRKDFNGSLGFLALQATTGRAAAWLTKKVYWLSPYFSQ